MALSPDDIVNHEFKQSLRGYAVAEVDDLLDRLADQVERTDQEVDDLRQRLRENEARLASALETESSIKRTLVTAQDAAERALQEAREQADELRAACEREVTEQLDRAHQEAERVVVEAQQRAATELDTARSERDVLEARIDELRSIERRHRDLLRSHLQGQLASLDDLDPVAPPLGGGSSEPVEDVPAWPPPDDGTAPDPDVGTVTPIDGPDADEALPSEGLAGWLDAMEDPGTARPAPGGPDAGEEEIPARWFSKPVDDGDGTPEQQEATGGGHNGADGPPAP